MPISSKNIIPVIRSISGSFTREQLIKALTSASRKKDQRGKNRKERRGGTAKDLNRIDEVLFALTGIGFLEKTKKSYRISSEFTSSGTIIIDGRGQGLMRTEDGGEFIIQKGDTGHAHSGDDVELEIISYKNGIFYARVARLRKRKKERYIARLEDCDRRLLYFKLLDLPGNVEVCSRRFQGEPGRGNCAVVQLTGKILSGLPECTVEEVFSADDELYDFRRVALRHGLPGNHPEYGELKKFNKSFIGREKKGRKDYRRIFTVTIDGENAKDFDDAISLEKEGTDYRLYVHIADVSAFVQTDGAIDREAEKRGTSFYLGNQVVPMLPEKLSNDLCSLREGVERLCLTAEIIIDAKGAVKGASFHRGIIKSDRRLTYSGAHEIVNGRGRSRLTTRLRTMYDLALILKGRRMKQGRVDLNLTDSEFIYEGNTLIDLITTRRLKSHLIIEEFMLTANEAASRILREKDIPTLYRIHETISEEKLAALIKFLQTLGLSVNRKLPIGNAIQEVIDKVRGREYEDVVNFIVLKSFMQAFYGTDPRGHFGLGFRDYTHFTSPIRRYPDLIVHRCIKNLITGKTAPYTVEQLVPVGEKSSLMERLAQNAERDLFKLKSCRLMSNRIGEGFDAVISGVSKYGFFVTLMEKPVEGMVPLRVLTDDYYLVQEDDFTIVGRRLGKRFRLGDRVKVRLVGVEIETMRIDFEVF